MRILNRLSVTSALTGLAVLMLTGCTNAAALQKKYQEEGIAYLEEGDYEKALESFQLGLDESNGKIDGNALNLCFYKADVCEKMGDYEGALETYDALLSYEESDEAYFLKGKLEYTMGNVEAGKADFDKAIACDEKNLALYVNIYNVLCQNDAKDLGVTYLEKGVKLGGNDASDSFQKGCMEYALGNNESAKGYLDKAVKGGITSGYFYLACIANDENDAGKEDENIKAYLASDSVKAEELEQLGVKKLNQDDYVKAVSYFKKALELDNVTNRQSIMRNCVIAYEKELDFRSAKNMMDEYIKLYPNDEEAQRESIFLNTRVED